MFRQTMTIIAKAAIKLYVIKTNLYYHITRKSTFFPGFASYSSYTVFREKSILGNQLLTLTGGRGSASSLPAYFLARSKTSLPILQPSSKLFEQFT